ncbi:S-adenosyl-L-methionine-dependent methyltransferase [Serendipita vermifera]|nr:S-adenosyl-L-methionine-dependent methyltransferase [Serendipita vermifera]
MQKNGSDQPIELSDTPLVKELHGRTFSNLSDIYSLPSTIDQDESSRMDKQGTSFKIVIGGLYFCPDIVEKLLYPMDGNQQKVLDVGCGTGVWATDMARRFPHVSVLGIDLAPLVHDPAKHPPNLRFQTYDINRGMTSFYDQFDFIQMRSVAMGLKDAAKTIQELQLCLKPGGFLTLIDGDPVNFISDERKPVLMIKLSEEDTAPSVSENGSWFVRMVHEASTGAKLSGSDMVHGHKLMDSGLWNHPLCDPDTAGAASFYMPLGPWATDTDPMKTRKLQIVGTLMQENLLGVRLAFQPVLLRHGVEKDTVEKWASNVEHELSNLTHKLRVHYRCCWARRRSLDGSSAPSLPDCPGFSSLPSALSTLAFLGDHSEPNYRDKFIETPYPDIEFYTSQEQAVAAMEKRNEAMRILPKAEVEKAWERKQRVAS